MAEAKFEFCVSGISAAKAELLMDSIIVACDAINAQAGGGFCDACAPDPVAQALVALYEAAVPGIEDAIPATVREQAEDALILAGYECDSHHWTKLDSGSQT